RDAVFAYITNSTRWVNVAHLFQILSSNHSVSLDMPNYCKGALTLNHGYDFFDLWINLTLHRLHLALIEAFVQLRRSSESEPISSWLGDMDSNHDSQLQRLLSYH